jgi:hypothetical protein
MCLRRVSRSLGVAHGSGRSSEILVFGVDVPRHAGSPEAAGHTVLGTPTMSGLPVHHAREGIARVMLQELRTKTESGMVDGVRHPSR